MPWAARGVLALLTLFERLAAGPAQPGQADWPAEPHAWGITFASHPLNAERMARIRAAAAALPPAP